MAGRGSAPGERRGGRKAGTSNKATSAAREAIAAFVDGNADRLTLWLDAIAEQSPKDAFNCFMSVVEYHIPKLARTEQRMVDKDGNDTNQTIIVSKLSDSTIEELLNASKNNA